MAAAGFYVLSFIFAVSMLVLLPKRSNKLNIIIDTMFSYVTVLNVAAFIAFIINIVGISITLISMGVIYTIIGITLGVILLVKRKRQSHAWMKKDFVSVGILILAVGLLMLHVFTPYIHANYYNNVDPYHHFLYAKTLARFGKLSGLFYNSLYNGMFLELFSWAIPQTWGYKAFIISDIYHIILELVFFYAAVLYATEQRKSKKYTALVWSLLYWASFLMFSFLWGFVYWSMAAMLAQYVLVLVTLRKDGEMSVKTVWALIGIGLFSVTMCYIQFAPVVVCAVAAIVLYDLFLAGKLHFNWKYVKFMVGIVVLLAIVALVGYKYVFHDEGLSFLYSLQMGEQQNIGLELVLLLPWVLLIILKEIREEKRLKDMQIAYMAGMAVQLLFTLLSICHIISSYYLQKGYIILFFLSIMVIIEGVCNLGKKTVQNMCIIFIGILGFFILSYDGSESKTVSLQQSTLVQNMDILAEYDFSEGELSDNDKIYLTQYAMEELRGENDIIPLIVSEGKGKGTGLWLDATFNDASFIWIQDAKCTEEQMTELLEIKGATYFMIFFDDLLYIYDLHDYFDSFERVYQNDAGFIGKVNHS